MIMDMTPGQDGHGSGGAGRDRKESLPVPDPGKALAQRELARAINADRWHQAAVRVTVAELRAAGGSWQDVADALGMTRQAVAQRFRDTEPKE